MIGSLGSGVDLDEFVRRLGQECLGHDGGELYRVQLVIVHVENRLPRVCYRWLSAVDSARLVRRSFFRYWFLGTTSVRTASAKPRPTADKIHEMSKISPVAGFLVVVNTPLPAFACRFLFVCCGLDDGFCMKPMSKGWCTEDAVLLGSLIGFTGRRPTSGRSSSASSADNDVRLAFATDVRCMATAAFVGSFAFSAAFGPRHKLLYLSSASK